MSSARGLYLPLACMSALVLAGCASAPASEGDLAADTAREIAPGLQPASAEEREIANRLPPLERANFWAVEYAKTPEDLETALTFARALAGIGSHERAVQVMTETEVLHPLSAEVKQVKARSLSAQDDFAGARRALGAAARLAPDNPDILASLGLANDRLGDHASAQAAYRQALEIDPDRVATLSNFGLSLALTGDLEAAEGQLRQAASLDSANTNVRQNLALILGLQGRFDEMLAVAGDAPEETMQRNVEVLRALRGEDIPAEALDFPPPVSGSEATRRDSDETRATGPALRRGQAG